MLLILSRKSPALFIRCVWLFLGGGEIEKHLWLCCNICEYSWLFFSMFYLLCAIWMFSSPNSDTKKPTNQLSSKEKELAMLVIARAKPLLLWQRQEWPRCCSAWAAISDVICQPAHNQVI